MIAERYVGDNKMKVMMTRIALLMGLMLAPFLHTQATAATVMINGTVTKAPWLDRYYRMEVDGIRYTFMPDVQIDAPFTSYALQPMSTKLARRFKVGQHLLIAKQGFRIYRVEFDK